MMMTLYTPFGTKPAIIGKKPNTSQKWKGNELYKQKAKNAKSLFKEDYTLNMLIFYFFL